MIYLVGGAPRCGKTTVAKKLSAKLGVPWISVDTLESIVTMYIPKGELDKLLPKRRLRRLTGRSNDRMYRKYSAQEITKAYIKQAKASWKAVEMMVDIEISNGHDYILEGAQLHPILMRKITDKHLDAVTGVVLVRHDNAAIIEGCLKNDAPNDWFVQKTKDPSTFPLIAEMIVEYSKFFQREAERADIPVVETDKRYMAQINCAVKTLLGK